VNRLEEALEEEHAALERAEAESEEASNKARADANSARAAHEAAVAELAQAHAAQVSEVEAHMRELMVRYDAVFDDYMAEVGVSARRVHMLVVHRLLSAQPEMHASAVTWAAQNWLALLHAPSENSTAVQSEAPICAVGGARAGARRAGRRQCGRARSALGGACGGAHAARRGAANAACAPRHVAGASQLSVLPDMLASVSLHAYPRCMVLASPAHMTHACILAL
jgi:hypothetical protein